MKTHPAIQSVLCGTSLSAMDMESAVLEIMNGQWTAVQIAAFLTALRMKRETVAELTGAVRAMKSRAKSVTVNQPRVLDTCGTGGDGANTFNISTTVAFVVASAGIPVAKHGNRSVSSRSGSADVLEAMGVHLGLDAEAVSQCIDTVGLGFLYAPSHHPAMKYAAPVRKELGFRTLFNLLGPLTNPANATHQLIGIFDGTRLMDLAHVLLETGTTRSMVVHGSDGLDEVTLSGLTHGVLVENGEARPLTITPEESGLTSAPLTTLEGGEAEENAGITLGILQGELPGPKTDIVLLNAGVALFVAQEVDSIRDGVLAARELLLGGAAYQRLQSLVEFTQDCA